MDISTSRSTTTYQADHAATHPSVQDVMHLAKQHILPMTEVGMGTLEHAFDDLSSTALDYADIYFQSSRSESWHLEDGLVKSGSFHITNGAGLRAVSGERSALAYSSDMRLPNLKAAAKSVKSILRQGYSAVVPLSVVLPQPQPRYSTVDPLLSLGNEDKAALLQELERIVRALEMRVVDVTANLTAHHDTVLILNHLGRIAADIRPLVRLTVNIIIQNGNGRREQGSASIGQRGDYTLFTPEVLNNLARQAVHQASVNMKAIAAPAGPMVVVLGPGWPGILLHEAVGHGLEGDLNRRGSSIYHASIGKRVAGRNITVVDDGTLPNRRGSLTVDDEGTATRRTVLIENGILKSYMQDTLNARLMKAKTTGNGRRQSYAHLPMPRMTNTFMLNGTTPPEEIISSVHHGLYAVNFGGGQVDITSGKFVFTTTEAYLIDQGRITHPVKGATLIGHGPDVLKKITLIGNDMALDSGIGTCGKNGQMVPVGVGQPTLRIEELTVGGTG